MTGDIAQKIEAANAEAVNRMVAGDPVLIDLAPAGEVIPGLTDRKVLHAGPPVEWSRMSGALRGAMIGAVLFEKWARRVTGVIFIFVGIYYCLTHIFSVQF